MSATAYSRYSWWSRRKQLEDDTEILECTLDAWGWLVLRRTSFLSSRYWNYNSESFSLRQIFNELTITVSSKVVANIWFPSCSQGHWHPQAPTTRTVKSAAGRIGPENVDPQSQHKIWKKLNRVYHSLITFSSDFLTRSVPLSHWYRHFKRTMKVTLKREKH